MMADQLAGHPDAGVVAAGYDARAFADAVLALVADYPRMLAGAAAAGEAWRARDGMDRFVGFLLDGTGTR